jgi:hypothetical protein
MTAYIWLVPHESELTCIIPPSLAALPSHGMALCILIFLSAHDQ